MLMTPRSERREIGADGDNSNLLRKERVCETPVWNLPFVVARKRSGVGWGPRLQPPDIPSAYCLIYAKENTKICNFDSFLPFLYCNTMLSRFRNRYFLQKTH